VAWSALGLLGTTVNVDTDAEPYANTSGTPPLAGKNDTVDRFTGAPNTAPAAACALAPRAPL
jgi:hypothetical protein